MLKFRRWWGRGGGVNKREYPDFRSPEVGISAIDLPGVCQRKICFTNIHLLFKKRLVNKKHSLL